MRIASNAPIQCGTQANETAFHWPVLIIAGIPPGVTVIHKILEIPEDLGLNLLPQRILIKRNYVHLLELHVCASVSGTNEVTTITPKQGFGLPTSPVIKRSAQIHRHVASPQTKVPLYTPHVHFLADLSKTELFFA